MADRKNGSSKRSRAEDVCTATRVAVLGGDGRLRPEQNPGAEVVDFKSPGDGGNGEARRLEASLRAGSFDLLVVLTRWNSHATTKKMKRICKGLGIRVMLAA